MIGTEQMRENGFWKTKKLKHSKKDYNVNINDHISGEENYAN
jgi:hypothetical protein